MARKRERLETDTGGSYFTSEKDLEFVTSGCQLIDCVLGGGYVLGRITNIIGDKSTAKTALATEAIINFLQKYDDGAASYVDVEKAFDESYSRQMGMPVEDVDFGDPENPVSTVEDLYRDLDNFLTERKDDNKPGIYVVDSLDALSDEASLSRDISESSYDMTKQKQLGKLFHDFIRRIGQQRVLIIIISQVRENIGVKFGEKLRRSGGKALDFYASQFLWLHHKGIVQKERKKVKRATGIKIIAKCKKNKVGLPFRQCEFKFLFGYGIDDIGANLEWLKSVGHLNKVDLKPKEINNFLEELEKTDQTEFEKERAFIAKQTRKAWAEIETTFLPTRQKYPRQ